MQAKIGLLSRLTTSHLGPPNHTILLFLTKVTNTMQFSAIRLLFWFKKSRWIPLISSLAISTKYFLIYYVHDVVVTSWKKMHKRRRTADGIHIAMLTTLIMTSPTSQHGAIFYIWTTTVTTLFERMKLYKMSVCGHSRWHCWHISISRRRFASTVDCVNINVKHWLEKLHDNSGRTGSTQRNTSGNG